MKVVWVCVFVRVCVRRSSNGRKGSYVGRKMKVCEQEEQGVQEEGKRELFREATRLY